MGAETKFFTEFPYAVEQLKIDNKGIVQVRVNVVRGMDEGGFHIYSAPAINVTGYGNTDKEAREGFHANVQVFIDDIGAMSTKKRAEHLTSLGWEKHHLFNKQYSKAYVDNDGNLQGFKNAEVSAMETIAA